MGGGEFPEVLLRSRWTSRRIRMPPRPGLGGGTRIFLADGSSRQRGRCSHQRSSSPAWNLSMWRDGRSHDLLHPPTGGRKDISGAEVKGQRGIFCVEGQSSQTSVRAVEDRRKSSSSRVSTAGPVYTESCCVFNTLSSLTVQRLPSSSLRAFSSIKRVNKAASLQHRVLQLLPGGGTR